MKFVKIKYDMFISLNETIKDIEGYINIDYITAILIDGNGTYTIEIDGWHGSLSIDEENFNKIMKILEVQK